MRVIRKVKNTQQKKKIITTNGGFQGKGSSIIPKPTKLNRFKRNSKKKKKSGLEPACKIQMGFSFLSDSSLCVRLGNGATIALAGGCLVGPFCRELEIYILNISRSSGFGQFSFLHMCSGFSQCVSQHFFQLCKA